MYQQICNNVKELVGNTYLYFDSPVQLSVLDKFVLFNIYGISISPANIIYVMDGTQDWWPVSEKDTTVLAALYVRVEKISSRYLGAMVLPSTIDNVLISEAI